MVNSIESARLQKLIESKEKLYKERKSANPDDKSLLYLNSEITLLRDVIMPIVLCNTTVDYSEIHNFVTLAMRKIEKNGFLSKKTTDIVFHFHIKNPNNGEKYIVAKASTMEERLNIFDIEINYEQALIYPI